MKEFLRKKAIRIGVGVVNCQGDSPLKPKGHHKHHTDQDRHKKVKETITWTSVAENPPLVNKTSKETRVLRKTGFAT